MSKNDLRKLSILVGVGFCDRFFRQSWLYFEDCREEYIWVRENCERTEISEVSVCNPILNH